MQKITLIIKEIHSNGLRGKRPREHLSRIFFIFFRQNLNLLHFQTLNH